LKDQILIEAALCILPFKPGFEPEVHQRSSRIKTPFIRHDPDINTESKVNKNLPSPTPYPSQYHS
jgi:hypothetical protein